MSNEQLRPIIERLGNIVGADSGLNGTLKLDFGEPGSVLIDGKSSPNIVCDGEGKSADCTISVSLENFRKISTRELDPMSAFLTGKIRVAGDMGLAMRLGPIWQNARAGGRA